MIEALMLVALGVLIMGLVALALAPVLWARAARVTAQRMHDELHAAALARARSEMTARFEQEMERREAALRDEIAALEASREKISAEASERVSELEQTRARLEAELASARTQHDSARNALAMLASEARALSARAESLDTAAQTLAGKAAAAAGETGGANRPDGHEADDPALRGEEAGRAGDTGRTAVETAAAEDAGDAPAAEGEGEGEGEAAPPRGATLAERIRALKEGITA